MNIRPDKVIYKAWLEILAELKETEYRNHRSDNLAYQPKDWKQDSLFQNLLQRKDSPIEATKYTPGEPPKSFEVVVLVANHILGVPIYHINIKYPAFNNFRKKCEDALNKQIINLRPMRLKDCFGCNDFQFWLKRVANGDFVINFSPGKDGNISQSFSFMKALTEYLKNHAERNGDWIKTVVPRKDVSDLVAKYFPDITEESYELRTIRNNLSTLVELHDKGHQFVEIGRYNQQNKGYPISVMIPKSLFV